MPCPIIFHKYPGITSHAGLFWQNPPFDGPPWRNHRVPQPGAWSACAGTVQLRTLGGKWKIQWENPLFLWETCFYGKSTISSWKISSFRSNSKLENGKKTRMRHETSSNITISWHISKSEKHCHASLGYSSSIGSGRFSPENLRAWKCFPWEFCGEIWGNVEKPAIGGLLGHVLHQFIGDLSLMDDENPQFQKWTVCWSGAKNHQGAGRSNRLEECVKIDGLISMLKKKLQESLFSVGWGHSFYAN